MAVTWTFGGTALSTYGTVTKMDDYLDMAERRGGNIEIPFRHGTLFTRKYYDERKITFSVAIFSASSSDQDYTFDQMKKSFGLLSQQVLSYTRADSSVYNANATMDSPMQVDRIHDTFAYVFLEFTLNEPFFRSNTLTTDNTTTISTTDTAMTVEHPGTIEERDPTILLTGPLANVTITTTDNVSLTYTGSIASTDTVTIGTSSGEYYATHSISGNVIGNVTHSGSSALLTIQPGTNTLSVKTTTTGGTVKISFYPPYL